MKANYTLVDDLKSHTSIDEKELRDRDDIFNLIQTQPRSLYRDCFTPGHITGSALLVSADRKRVLLNHHKTLKCWLQFGGHADGETDILAVARREVEEESGFTEFDMIGDGLVDVDIHLIPANSNRNEPQHLHHDIRYIFALRSDDDRFRISDESLDLRWCDVAQAMELVGPGSLARLLRKWQERV